VPSGGGALRKITFKDKRQGAIIAANKKIFTTNNAGGIYRPAFTLSAKPSGISNLCQGDTLRFLASGSDSWTYTWYQNQQIVGSGKTIKLTFNTPGPQDIAVVVSNGVTQVTKHNYVGVSSNQTVNPFTVNVSHTHLCPGYRPVGATTNAAYVYNTPVTFRVNNAQAGVLYKLYTGSGNGINLPATFTPTNVMGNLNYFVVGQMGNAQCGYSTDTVRVLITIDAEAYLLGTRVVEDTICLNGPVTLGLATSVPGYSYQFSADNGTYSAPVTGTGGAVRATLPASGTSTSLIWRSYAVSPNGCEFFATDNDRVKRDTVFADMGIAYLHYCNNDSLVPLQNSYRATQWHWQSPAGVFFSDSLAAVPVITFSADTGSRQLLLIATNSFGCKAMDTQTVYVHQPAPVPAYNRCYRTSLEDIQVLDQHTDRHGQMYVCGYHMAATAIDIHYHMVFMKFDISGNLVWQRWTYPNGTGYRFSAATGITTDDAGNVYVCGNYYSQTITLGTLTLQGTNVAASQGFITKLDKNGNYIWAISTATNNTGTQSYNTSFFSDIEYTGNGQLLAGGKNNALVNFTNGPVTINGPVTLDTLGNFVRSYKLNDLSGAPYNVSLAQIYPYAFATDYYCNYPKIHISSGNTYLYGAYKTLQTDSVQLSHNYINSYGFFVGKLGPASWQWLRPAGSCISRKIANTFAADSAGNYYVLQNYLDKSSTYIAGGPNQVYFPSSAADTFVAPVAYISKYAQSTGNLVWRKKFPSVPIWNTLYLTDPQIAFAGGNLYLLALLVYENFAGYPGTDGKSISFHLMDYPNAATNQVYNAGLLKLDLNGYAISAQNLGRVRSRGNWEGSEALMTTDRCQKTLFVSAPLLSTDVYNPPYPNFSTASFLSKYTIAGNCYGTCNIAPQAAALTTPYCGQSLLLNVAGQVSDAEGDTIFITTVLARYGTVVANGLQLSYTPPATGHSNDTIAYYVCDEPGNCTTGKIYLSYNPQGSSFSAEVCQGQSFLFNGQNLTAPGVYTNTLIATDGCDSVITLTLGVNALPAVTLSGNAGVVCSNQAPVQLTGGLPAGGSYSGTGVTGNVFNPATAGLGIYTITYTYTDGANCTNTASEQIEVSSCLGVATVGKTLLMQVYPNPAQNVVMINLSDNLTGGSLTLTDVTGRILNTMPVTALHNELNTAALSSGVYLLTAIKGGDRVVQRVTISQ
jgi:hypothetical protein